MSPMSPEIALPATTERFELGEGPVWDPVRQHLLWVDITRGLVLTGRLDREGHVTVVDSVAVDQTVGAVAVSESGEWIVAGANRLFVRQTSGRIVPGHRLVVEGGRRRLNDGKPDPSGSFVVGTLSYEPGSVSEELIRVDAVSVVQTIDRDLGQANGLAWSVDNKTFYNVDSDRRVVFKRAYDNNARTFGPREVHIEVTEGVPDGLCVDAENCLWVALWGVGKVVRYAADGLKTDSVHVPAPHTSSVAFAGLDREVMIITTARFGLTQEQLAGSPTSGSLFSFVPRVPGHPVSLWNANSSESPYPKDRQ